MQFQKHEYLTPIHPKADIYNCVFPLVAMKDGEAYHVGSSCVIGPGLLVTAKHVLRYMFEKVAKEEVKGYGDPDVMESPEGPLFDILLKHGIGLDALHFIEDGLVQRYSVTNYIKIWHKYTDLLVLHVKPHPGYPVIAKPQWHIPTLDLAPPRAGLDVKGVGYPDHPDHGLVTPDPWLRDYLLYQGTGVVEVTCSPKVKPLQTGLLTSIPVYSAEERTVRNEKEQVFGRANSRHPQGI